MTKSKSPAFEKQAVLAGLASLGVNVENTNNIVAAREAFLADPAKCQQLVAIVQGADAATSDKPTDMARYQKRAGLMFDAAVAEPPPPKTDKATVEHVAGTANHFKMTMPAKSDASSTDKNGTQSAGDVAASAAVNLAGTTSTPTPSGAGQRKSRKDTTKEGHMASKKTKATRAARVPKEKADKKPAVIDTIVKILSAGGGTIEDIAAKLKKAFPDRKLDGLTATTKIQMSRLQTPKKDGGRGLKIKREKTEGSNVLVYSI